jgi:hypothetical protein
LPGNSIRSIRTVTAKCVRVGAETTGGTGAPPGDAAPDFSGGGGWLADDLHPADRKKPIGFRETVEEITQCLRGAAELKFKRQGFIERPRIVDDRHIQRVGAATGLDLRAANLGNVVHVAFNEQGADFFDGAELLHQQGHDPFGVLFGKVAGGDGRRRPGVTAESEGESLYDLNLRRFSCLAQFGQVGSHHLQEGDGTQIRRRVNPAVSDAGEEFLIQAVNLRMILLQDVNVLTSRGGLGLKQMAELRHLLFQGGIDSRLVT